MKYCKLKSVYTIENKKSAARRRFIIIVACCALKMLALSCFLNVRTLKYITLQETLPRLSYNPINSTRAKLISTLARPFIKICAPPVSARAQNHFLSPRVGIFRHLNIVLIEEKTEARFRRFLYIRERSGKSLPAFGQPFLRCFMELVKINNIAAVRKQAAETKRSLAVENVFNGSKMIYALRKASRLFSRWIKESITVNVQLADFRARNACF